MAERDVIFVVGDQKFGMDVTLVKAIEPMMAITPIPNAPRCIRGLMNLRGEVIPVYSLRRRFDWPDGKVSSLSKLIVTRYDGKALAFDVDEVLEMRDFDRTTVTPQPTITKNERTGYIRSIGHSKGELVLLIDPSSVFEGDEEERMNKIIEELK